MVDGIIALGVSCSELGDLQVPVVTLHAQSNVTSYVDLDLEALIGHAMTSLKARGCRRVALLGPVYAVLPQPDDLRYATARLAQQRVELFHNEVRRQGLATRTEWLCGIEGMRAPTMVLVPPLVGRFDPSSHRDAHAE